MDNVMNRPMFRRRDARDRLNDMAGVQNTVQGYQIGGGIVADPTGAIQRPFQQPTVRPAGLPSLATSMGTKLDVAPFTRTEGATLGLNAPGLERATSADLPRLEDFRNSIVRQIDAAVKGEDGQAIQLLQDQLSAIDDTISRVGQVPGPVSTRDAFALEGPEAVVSQMAPEQLAKLDIFSKEGPLDRAADNVAPGAPPVPAPVRPGQTGFIRPEVSAPTGLPAAEPAGPSGMEAETRGRGPLITNPMEVAAGLNNPDPAAREKTAADFMAEFTANAPKYEGMDKNLMHAMIGFSIAAGDSPNAMQNIANGLQSGAQMFLQDKAAKAEFDRQLQLSAMQYGLQESTKERDRARQPLTFVALQDTTYKGKPVKAGDQVYIPYGEIEKNGGVVPSGFGDTSMVTAISDRQKGMLKAIERARQENLIDDSFAEGQRDKFSGAARNAMAAQRGIDYMESAILKVAEDGSITGLKGAADSFIGKVAAAAGVDDISEQYNDRAQVVSLVQKAFQNLIPAALSGVQTANSISNRDIELLANAYVDSMLENGVFSMSTITEEKLLNSMKSALDLLQNGRQTSLTDMSAIEKTLMDRTLRSGAAATSVIEPYRQLIPGQSEVSVPSQLGTLYRAEDGIYDIMQPGG